MLLSFFPPRPPVGAVGGSGHAILRLFGAARSVGHARDGATHVEERCAAPADGGMVASHVFVLDFELVSRFVPLQLCFCM